MRLTHRLLSRLHRVFDKDPVSFVAFRLARASGSWQTAEGSLVLRDSLGATLLSVDLAAYSLGGLAGLLSTQPGVAVTDPAPASALALSATVLLDGGGLLSSDPVPLSGYTSPLWAILEAWSAELGRAKAQVIEAIRQVTLTTAEAEWVDEHGDVYGVRRAPGEFDGRYAARIIAEVLAPKGNNVAIEAAIRHATGQVVTVVDVVEYGAAVPIYNGAITHNGAADHNAEPALRYGLFDVQVGLDVLGGEDPTEFLAVVSAMIARLRDAGTHLRSLSLAGSVLDDAMTPPADGWAGTVLYPLADTDSLPTDVVSAIAVRAPALSDASDPPDDDDDSISLTLGMTYNGLRRHDGAIPHSGGANELQRMDGTIVARGTSGATLGVGVLGTMTLGVP